MDERTRKTDDEWAPGARRLIPEPVRPWVEPWVKAPRRSRWRLAVGAIAALLVVFAIYQTAKWVRSAPAPAGRFQGAQQTVGAATAALGNVRVIVNALGTVTPLATVNVQTQINGQLNEVGFTEG